MNDMGVAAFAWAVISRVAYVGWVGAVLMRVRGETRRRTEVHPGFEQFRRTASVLMINDAIAIGVVSIVTRDTLALPWLPAFIAGVLLTIVGIASKSWAVRTLGWSACVWEDFFHGPVSGGGRWGGPYRYLDNPMYTLGYLHAWGFPLMLRSWPGLIAGAFAHISMLVFLWIVERPHVRAYYARMY